MLDGMPPLDHLRFSEQIQSSQSLPNSAGLAGVGSKHLVLARRRDNPRDSSVARREPQTGVGDASARCRYPLIPTGSKFLKQAERTTASRSSRSGALWARFASVGGVPCSVAPAVRDTKHIATHYSSTLSNQPSAAIQRPASLERPAPP